MTNLIRKFIRCESGATAVEYALLAGLIGLVIISGVTTLGTTLRTKFTAIATGLN